MKTPTLTAQIEAAQTELENLQTRRKDERAAIESLDDKILKGNEGAMKDAAARRETVAAIDRKVPRVETQLETLRAQFETEQAKDAAAAAEIEKARALAEIDTDLEATVARLGTFVEAANLCAGEVETLLTRINRNPENTGGTRATRNAHQLLYNAQPRGLSIGEAGMWGAIETLINSRAGVVVSKKEPTEVPNELERRFRMS